jgi:hypothetical protein
MTELRSIVLLLVVAGGCAPSPGVQLDLNYVSNKGLRSPAELAFYVSGPESAFEKYFEVWKSNDGDRCDINAKVMACTAAIVGGGPVADQRIAETGMSADDLMSQSYEALEKHCAGRAEERSEGARSYAIYDRRLQRTGMSLPYAEKAVALAGSGTYAQVASLSVLADVHAAMGWFEQRDDARLRAVRAGRAYFRFDASTRPETPDVHAAFAAASQAQAARFSAGEALVARDQIRLWNEVLEATLEELSWSRDPHRLENMHGVWGDLALMCPATLSCQLVAKQYPRAVVRFARAGDVSFAKTLQHECNAGGTPISRTPLSRMQRVTTSTPDRLALIARTLSRGGEPRSSPPPCVTATNGE